MFYHSCSDIFPSCSYIFPSCSDIFPSCSYIFPSCSYTSFIHVHASFIHVHAPFIHLQTSLVHVHASFQSSSANTTCNPEMSCSFNYPGTNCDCRNYCFDWLICKNVVIFASKKLLRRIVDQSNLSTVAASAKCVCSVKII